jgi:hypothetical protein
VLVGKLERGLVTVGSPEAIALAHWPQAAAGKLDQSTS